MSSAQPAANSSGEIFPSAGLVSNPLKASSGFPNFSPARFLNSGTVRPNFSGPPIAPKYSSGEMLPSVGLVSNFLKTPAASSGVSGGFNLLAQSSNSLGVTFPSLLASQ